MDYINDTYKVYVKTDENGIITAVNSSAFLPNAIIEADRWTEIDEGTGDRYHHAQGNYFDKPLIDENGLYNYKLIDTVDGPVKRTAEDKQPDLDRLNARAEITQLKAKLAATDYIGIKIGEGAATEEEYKVQRAERAAWRARINELEDMYG